MVFHFGLGASKGKLSRRHGLTGRVLQRIQPSALRAKQRVSSRIGANNGTGSVADNYGIAGEIKQNVGRRSGRARLAAA